MNLNYAVVGTNDMEDAVAFYDALFGESGVRGLPVSERMTYWLGEDFAFAAALPFDGQPASIGNGMMIGFGLKDAEEVRRMHAKAMALGAVCEGAPGQRGPKFSAYLRDLDGNKLCFSD